MCSLSIDGCSVASHARVISRVEPHRIVRSQGMASRMSRRHGRRDLVIRDGPVGFWTDRPFFRLGSYCTRVSCPREKPPGFNGE
jgi:hypothetical protein